MFCPKKIWTSFLKVCQAVNYVHVFGRQCNRGEIRNKRSNKGELWNLRMEKTNPNIDKELDDILNEEKELFDNKDKKSKEKVIFQDEILGLL